MQKTRNDHDIVKHPLKPNKKQLWKFQIICVTFPEVRDVSIWAKN